MLLAFHSPPGVTDPQYEPRLSVGARQFPSLVAADLDIGSKRSPDGGVHLVVVYADDIVRADNVVQRLSAIKKMRYPEEIGTGEAGKTTRVIREVPVRITLLPVGRLSELNDTPPAALFIAERLPRADLERIVRLGIEQRRLVFSPYLGDVESGVTSGMHISDRILPMVNQSTLQAAGIRLKSMLLSVTRIYR